MTTQELIEELHEVKTLLNDESTVRHYLKGVLTSCERVLDLNHIFNSYRGEESDDAVEQWKDFHQRFVRQNKEINLPKFFLNMAKLKDGLTAVSDRVNEQADNLKILIKVVEAFEKSYELFVKNSIPSSSVSLIISSLTLEAAIVSTTEAIDLVTSSLSSSLKLRDDEQELSLFFYYSKSYHESFEKLKNLEDLYSEICSVLGISTANYPLRIVKIESGSLWIDVIGHVVSITFLAWFLKEAVKYFHRNWTAEGKISLIPKEIETADKILEFSKKLEAAGVDVNTNKENLNKVLITITNKLNKLVENQPKIKIDNEVFSVGEDYERKLLEANESHLIGDGKESGKPNKELSE